MNSAISIGDPHRQVPCDQEPSRFTMSVGAGRSTRFWPITFTSSMSKQRATSMAGFSLAPFKTTQVKSLRASMVTPGEVAVKITHAWVHKRHRGKGLGRALVLAAESEALQRGCEQVVLMTHSFQAP